MDGAIIPLTTLTNRAQKRQFIREAIKIAGELEEVNTVFIWYLFNADKTKSYKEIYLSFLDKWQATVKSLVENKKFSHCAIDVLFFERNYKPNLYY